MLSFDEVLSTTKAVRQRLDLTRPLPREVVLECCELANYAPSSRNTQPWSFVFVEDAAKKAQVAQLYAAVWSFMLAARSRGIGTSWTSLHLIKEQEMAEVIGVDAQQYTQLALIPIAYSVGTDFKKPPRRDLGQAVFFNGMK